jgi:SAM-dependent methyltransferase
VSFKDHFSERSSQYARARPGYPAELFLALARLAPARETAWDVGTGSGQAALGLADHFGAVLATDASAAQLAEAPLHPRVTYRQGREAASGLPDRSVDLVTVAQAAHWFDLAQFYREALRVLRPGGILAIWCYGLCRIGPEIDPALARFYSVTVGPFWTPERIHVENGYRGLSFPLPDFGFPDVAMELDWSMAEMVAYMRTWSAVAAYEKAHGDDPVAAFEPELASTWGNPHRVRRIRWPLSGRIGRVSG